MKIVRGADRKRMPWKNGMGFTEEVAVFPAGSNTASFDWRLSIAHVSEDGPFSTFAGIDRTIALLDGPGLALNLPDGRSITLTPNTMPFAFPGDWTISSRNLGGPTINLNMMTRRGRCTHKVRPLTLNARSPLASSGPCWVIFKTAAQIELLGRPHPVDRLDAMSVEAGETVTGLTDAEILIVDIRGDMSGEQE